MSCQEDNIRRMNYYNHNQKLSKYKNRYRFLMECSTLEATYVFYYSSARVIFQGICSCMMPMADIHNKNKIGTCQNIMNKTNKNYLQAIIHNHACYCCIHYLHTRSKYLIIIILCKYSKCAYMYALLVPYYQYHLR